MTVKERLHEVIFEADTREGKVFDIVLLVAIFLSVLVVMLESVPSIHDEYYLELYVIEWFFTLLFTAEYVLRIWIIKKPWGYILSFYGIIDFLSILPTYISLFVIGSQSLIVIRGLRLLRIFRILKLPRYIGESDFIIESLARSRRKIAVFLFAVMLITIIFGTIMFLIEGPEHGFTSIPTSIYWAIVTLTTVGYGDISPGTVIGQMLASFIMILGYGIIAVPTGIVTAEMARSPLRTNTQSCPTCGESKHLNKAEYCHNCGQELNAHLKEDSNHKSSNP
jgi:voltage-gated potassium channel